MDMALFLFFIDTVLGIASIDFCLVLPSDEPDKIEEMLPKFYDYQRKADMYYAYHSIQRYTVSLVWFILCNGLLFYTIIR